MMQSPIIPAPALALCTLFLPLCATDLGKDIMLVCAAASSRAAGALQAQPRSKGRLAALGPHHKNSLCWQRLPGRRASSLVPRTAEVQTAPLSQDQPDPAATVDRVLQLIADTENGDNATPAQREEIDSLINQLETIGQTQSPRPLDNDIIFDHYNVAYVSTGRKQQGQPAGGRFRTGIGKLLFRTTVLAQSVLQPDIVTNKVGFALLGVLHGAVGLRGKLVSIPEEEGGADNRDTVKVFFEPPVLSVGSSIHTRIGPPSSVVLKTTYLDDKVRLGRGSRGSLFVFTRGGEAAKAGMDMVGLERTTRLGGLLLVAFVGALTLGGSFLSSRPHLPPPVRAAGIVSSALGLALVAVLWRGGQFNENTDRPEVAKPAAAAAGAAGGFPREGVTLPGQVPPNVAEARAWVEAWRQRSGVPANVAEARAWVQAWRQRSGTQPQA